MGKPDRSAPMPVKHWSFAGLLLTYGCGARCASCYVCSGPAAGGDMDVDDALAFWEGLCAASPHGCRIHIGGGEPFRRWEELIELARRAQREGLGPLEAVETNAFWATDARTVRDRAAALDAAGMGRLTLSADPYHQQFVPIERVRRAARVAAEVLGAGRVRVRWRDWAEAGFDTGPLDARRRREVFAAYARRGRDRIAGRAAAELAPLLDRIPAEALAGACRQRLLRSRHVHVDGEGIVCAGTCAGVVLGRVGEAGSVGLLWRRLSEAFASADRPGEAEVGWDVLRVLVRSGAVGLAARAAELGYEPAAEGYVGRCHLCWDVRRWLFEKRHFPGQLGPAQVYRP